jgi:hypothetical protein
MLYGLCSNADHSYYRINGAVMGVIRSTSTQFIPHSHNAVRGGRCRAARTTIQPDQRHTPTHMRRPVVQAPPDEIMGCGAVHALLLLYGSEARKSKLKSTAHAMQPDRDTTVKLLVPSVATVNFTVVPGLVLVSLR